MRSTNLLFAITLGVQLREALPSSLYYNTKVVRQQSVDPSSLLFYEDEYPFALVSDLDTASRHPQKFEWKSLLKRGRIVRKLESRHSGMEKFGVEWDTEQDRTLTSDISRKNRSMELSELVTYNHLLLGMCDYTGIVYKIEKQDGRIFQRHLITDGNGDEPKPFKSEWATVKDGLLFIGSFGLEWIEKGKIKHRNPEWVKTISTDGTIENINWHPIYQAIRSATNTTFPGYLWHEAVHWDPRSRLWVMLPRKASTSTIYSPKTDETMGANLIVLCSEDFTDIQVRRFKPRTVGHPPPASPNQAATTSATTSATTTTTTATSTRSSSSSSSSSSHGSVVSDSDAIYESSEYGFTSVRKLPGSTDLFVATKVREVTSVEANPVNGIRDLEVDHTHTVMCVFDLEGNIRSEPRWIEVGEAKFEGLEFV
jgi:soluble calcium-activated nucleotidase 1